MVELHRTVGRSRGKDGSGLEQPRSEPVDPDAWLLRAVAQGDRAALARLYDRYAPAAYGLAVRLIGSGLAEDVVHDAFVVLVARPTSYDPARGSFRAWFLTSVHHRCLSLLRQRQRLAGEAALENLTDPAPEPVDEVVNRLADREVRTALGALSTEQREVLVLAYYGGLSQSALAARLSLPLGTVKARMRRGLLALRGLLRENDVGVEET